MFTPVNHWAAASAFVGHCCRHIVKSQNFRCFNDLIMLYIGSTFCRPLFGYANVYQLITGVGRPYCIGNAILWLLIRCWRYALLWVPFCLYIDLRQWRILCLHSIVLCLVLLVPSTPCNTRFLSILNYLSTLVFLVCFLSVLWHCWLGDRKGIRPVKNWVSVCWWWWLDWSFAQPIAPVVTHFHYPLLQ